MQQNPGRVAVIFKAFCDENRIRILELLTNGEKCATILLKELNISQPTLSHHMKILCDSGVVESRKEGRTMIYSISVDGTTVAMKYIEKIMNKH